jgi:hypothetical protein
VLPGDHDADSDSSQGLGGFHGSVNTGGDTWVYYAVGVYSENGNGIPFFDDNEAWKNVVVTFYHELNEIRTNPDVGQAAGAQSLDAGKRYLSWYSLKNGEIGDIPMMEAGNNLGQVITEVEVASHPGITVPIQRLWSNAEGRPWPSDGAA